MNRALLVWICAGVLVGAMIAAVGVRVVQSSRAGPAPTSFAAQVDLSPLETVAVHTEGRLKSYPSFADSLMRHLVGPRPFRGQAHGFTLLDMVFRPEQYENRSVVHVSNRQIRRQIADRLDVRPDVPEEYLSHYRRTGMIAPTLLSDDAGVQELLERLKRDAVSTARHVTAIENALLLRSPRVLAEQLRVLPPSVGGREGQWGSVAERWPEMHGHGHGHAHVHEDGHGHADPHPHLHLHPDTEHASAGVEPEVAETRVGSTQPGAEDRVAQAWAALARAWRDEDAERVNASLEELASSLVEAAPDGVYPARSKLWWESWYYNAGHMTWVWLVYMLSAVLILLSIVYRWPYAHRAGLAVFLAALVLHTFAVLLRGYIAGRWPNANMFEAVTTSAWFGAVGAVALEWAARRTPMRGFFALGAAFAGAAALMSAHFLPVGLDASVANMMPILHDVWLYIHTNVIIFSYCLIAMAAVSSSLYLCHRLAGAEADYARAGGAASLLRMQSRTGRIAGDGGRVPLAQVLDGVTMVLFELAFILLWAGIVMGAIWADHSWGRPWGWDPKEVFALNTFIIFVILLHVRMKVRDKGLWTAVLALIGFVSMLFNWIVINFVIAGLHSYA